MNTTVTTGQLTKTLEIFKEKGLTPEKYQQALESGFLSDVVQMIAITDCQKADRDEVREALGLERRIPNPEALYFTIEMNSELSIDNLVLLGNYEEGAEQVLSDKKAFPLVELQDGIRLLALLKFRRAVTTEEVLIYVEQHERELFPDSLGCAPGTIIDLLTLRAQHPQLQRNFPIVALGSVATLSRFKPEGCTEWVCWIVRSAVSAARKIGFQQAFRRQWPAHTRFLIAEKPSKQ